MVLFDIIKSLQSAEGSNAKAAILKQHKDNTTLQLYLKAVCDPAISYYQKKSPEYKKVGDKDLLHDGMKLLTLLSTRAITGNEAKRHLTHMFEQVNKDSQELLELIINRSIGAGVGDTMVLKVWPDLYFVPPYQRCSLMDNKIKAKFNKLPFFYIQSKLDGAFCYLKTDDQGNAEAITQAGNKYPKWFAQRLAFTAPTGVLVGELEVYYSKGNVHYLLDRKTGNGVLNSVLQDGDEDKFLDYEFTHTSWDLLTLEEFKAGKSDREYESRLDNLTASMVSTGSLKVVYSKQVTSMKEAMKIYTEHTSKGLEGCVIKDPNSLWKNGTAKDIVKLKIKFPVDLVVTGILEGEGKYKGMMGAISVATSDGLLTTDVGIGFSDEDRKNPPKIGDIVLIEANDITSNRSSDIKSLFLPVFQEVRYDKTVADTLEEVVAQLEAAKSGCIE